MLGRLGFCVIVWLILLVCQNALLVAGDDDFVRVSGSHFILHGRSFYSNGFNAYWLLDRASDPTQRHLVTEAFKHATEPGMSIVRTWATCGGGGQPLQLLPGKYDEDMFRSLDFVISEAKGFGVHLILSFLVNDPSYAERRVYVQWAKDRGEQLSSDDDFYRSEVVRGFYRDHVRTVITRVNTITNVTYRDDPTIFAWELMSEPRCQTDLSGKTVQDWISIMAKYVKSLDSNHLLEVGLEGFYGPSTPEKFKINPGFLVGTDYITNHQVEDIDFITIHAYPDQWTPGANEEGQMNFLQNWLRSHIDDASWILRKPIMVTEFGRSSKLGHYETGQRDRMFNSIYNVVYGCARGGGPCAGALFWQLLVEGMDNYRDGYEVIMSEQPSTANIITLNSRQISGLDHGSSDQLGMWV